MRYLRHIEVWRVVHFASLLDLLLAWCNPVIELEVGVETSSPAKVYEPLTGDGPLNKRLSGWGSVVLPRASPWLVCSLWTLLLQVFLTF